MAMHQANRDYKQGVFLLAPIILFLLVVLGYVMTEVVNNLWFKPWLLTIGVFYWTLYCPKSIPLWFALILGLLEDGLAGTPFGLYGLGILLMHYMTYQQRQSLIHSPFTMVLTGFIINSFVVFLLMSLIMWLIGLPILTLTFVSWLTTSFMFVPVALFMGYVKQSLMKD